MTVIDIMQIYIRVTEHADIKSEEMFDFQALFEITMVTEANKSTVNCSKKMKWFILNYPLAPLIYTALALLLTNIGELRNSTIF